MVPQGDDDPLGLVHIIPIRHLIDLELQTAFVADLCNEMNWNPVNENFRELATSIHSEFIQLVEQQFGAWILFPSNVAQLDREVAHDTCPKYLSVTVSKRLRGQYICRSQGKIKIITSPIEDEVISSTRNLLFTSL